MITFGMPTLLEHDTLEESAQLCRELGLQFIELNMNLPQYQLHTMAPETLRGIAEQYKIGYTLHLDENLNVSDFNPRIADAYMQTVLDSIAFAEKLNISILNMHLSRGVYFTMPDRKIFLYERYRSQYMKRMEQFRDACTKAIGSKEVKICIENSSGYTALQLDVLNLLLQSPVFSLTVDTGHDFCTGGADGEWISSHLNSLHHMHLHDAAEKKDHLVLGTGQVDLHHWLHIAEYRQARVVIETKTAAGLKESVRWLQTQKM